MKGLTLGLLLSFSGTTRGEECFPDDDDIRRF